MLSQKKGLWNVVRVVGHSKGEEKCQCVTLILEVIGLSSAY